MRLLIDARASASASVDARTRAVARWRGGVFLNTVKLEIKEAAANERNERNERNRRSNSHRDSDSSSSNSNSGSGSGSGAGYGTGSQYHEHGVSHVTRTHSIVELRGVGCNAAADGAGAADDPSFASSSDGGFNGGAVQVEMQLTDRA
jgi:hypothetical protein